jgi:gamma-tubulin complex component 2
MPASLEPTPLKLLSPDLQEAAILDDLLYCFMGYEGQYIRFQDSYDPTEERDRLAGPSFRILPGMDPCLQDLTITMLKMATHYMSVVAFVEVQSREEFGSINHALCAAIRKLLKEYLVLIAQMEQQLSANISFTLHVLQLHVLPTSHMMFQLYTLAQELLKKNRLLEEDLDSMDDLDDVENILEQLREGGELAPGGMSKKICKGGNVLRLLTERLSYMSGDPAARGLLRGLLRDASRPYMAMLNEWLHHGGIKDPHSEFLIKEQKSIRRDRLEEDYTDEYWEKRYTIREGDVPPQLESVKDKVLLAGKYLNVVRECGGVDISTEVKDVPKSFDVPDFLHNVNSAYAHANSSLLKLLLTTHALPARLRSMKHYFFLDRSEFFSYFLYLSSSELKKPVKDVNVGKLQSLLDLVLRQPGSVAAQDPFKEDIKIHMNDQYLIKFLMGVVNVRGFDQDGNDESLDRHRTPATQPAHEDDGKMTGFEALEFKYAVPFPLSLVISSKTVVRYQILFRYLLSMRHLEGLLVNSWEDHNKVMSWTHKSGDRKLELWKRRMWTLRARMLNFVQQFMYYCTSEVIEPNWNSLMAKVNGTSEPAPNSRNGETQVNRTVDELMEDHVDFLDTCLKECMLMNSKLLRVMHPPPSGPIYAH